MNIEKEYVYFWYHGGIPWAEVDSIEDSINNKDYETFMKYKKKYSRRLPKKITIFENYDIVGYLDVTKENNFKMITSNDHENG